MSERRSPGTSSRDFTSHQLREARAEAVSLAAKNERLVAALTEARERIVELGTQLDSVTLPPVTFALLTGIPAGGRRHGADRPSEDRARLDSPGRAGGYDTHERTISHPRVDVEIEDVDRPAEVDVMLSGRPMRLGLHASIDVRDLAVGQLVAVNDRMLVVDALPAPDTGEAVTVEEVLVSSGSRAPRALVTTGSGATRILHLAGRLDAEALSPGDTLAADLRAGLATALVERTSVEQLVGSEAPTRSSRSATLSSCPSPIPTSTAPTACAPLRDFSCTALPAAGRRSSPRPWPRPWPVRRRPPGRGERRPPRS